MLQSEELAAIFDEDVLPGVVALFLWRAPAAVVRLIVAIVVDAIQSQLVAISVGKSPAPEALKVVFPFVANTDPPASV